MYNDNVVIRHYLSPYTCHFRAGISNAITAASAADNPPQLLFWSTRFISKLTHTLANCTVTFSGLGYMWDRPDWTSWSLQVSGPWTLRATYEHSVLQRTSILVRYWFAPWNPTNHALVFGINRLDVHCSEPWKLSNYCWCTTMAQTSWSIWNNPTRFCDSNNMHHPRFAIRIRCKVLFYIFAAPSYLSAHPNHSWRLSCC